MKFLLLPLGTAGDVHPFLGVGRALRARGHHVTVITNRHFEPLSRRLGLDFVALGTDADYQRVLADPDLWHPLRCARVLAAWGLPLIPRQFATIERLHEPGQTIVVSGAGAGAGALGARIAHGKCGERLPPAGLRRLRRAARLAFVRRATWLNRVANALEAPLPRA